MASLIDRFQALFRRAEQQPGATTIAPAVRSPLTAFAVDGTRRAIVTDCRTMCREDPRAKGVLLTLARDVTKGGFELHVEGPRAQQALDVANALLERLKVYRRLDFWTYASLRDGDSFLELGADASGLIQQVERKPTMEMYRWTDERDQFIDPTKAFFWTDRSWLVQPPSDALFFAEWQIIHVRYDQDENERYGTPLFASARGAHRRVKEGELDLAIRRKVRAGKRLLHSLEDASEADLLAYKERNQVALSDPFAAAIDYFSTTKTSIQELSGDANLSDIEDVLHHLRTWWVAAPVPMPLLGYGQDLNRDVLEEQTEQYQAAKEKLSEWLTAELVAPLIERQWLLLGIWPESLVWDVEWASKQAITPAGLQAASTALVGLRASGLFTDETLVRLFSRFVPGFDADAEIAAMAAARPDEIERMAGGVSRETSDDDAGDV